MIIVFLDFANLYAHTALGCEFDRVTDKIDDYLAQSCWVAEKELSIPLSIT